MKVIINNIIPFKGFVAINFLGLCIFARKEIGERTIHHESIHSAQYKETLWVGFLLVYVIEWLVRMVIEVVRNGCSGASKRAYKKISFEQEAYSHDCDLDYLSRRKHYEWIKFLTK